MKISVLGSGSKGNSTIIDFDGYKIVIDIGFSYKAFLEKSKLLNYEINDIKNLFITHEHSDHILGVKTFLSKNKSCILNTSLGTFKYLLNHEFINEIPNECILKYMEKVTFGNFSVIPFFISHDANEPMGYMFYYENKKIVYLTDCGYVSYDLLELLKGADCYIFEANHDPELLLLSNRPFYLKQRILGDRGHLSNQDSAIVLSKLITDNTKEIILAHLSQECNTEDICINTFLDTFKHYNIDIKNINIRLANQFNPVEVIL